MTKKEFRTTTHRSENRTNKKREQIERKLKAQRIPIDPVSLVRRFEDDVIHNRENVRTYLESLKPPENSFERYLETGRLQEHAVYIANLIIDDSDMVHVDMGLQFFDDLNSQYQSECKRYGVVPIGWKREIKHLIKYYSSDPFKAIPDLAFRRFDPYWTEWKVTEN